MGKIEKKIIFFIEKNRNILFFLIVSLLGAAARYVGGRFASGDMHGCLVPWYEEIASKGGFKSLKEQVGDYNILYQTIIALMTYVKINCVVLYKALSIVFDYLLAFSSAYFVCELSSKKKFDMVFNCVYATILLFPTVVLNSAFWGQCDSIYSFFLIMTLLFLFKEKYYLAFVFLGIAFAFKLQAIFIIPFLIFYYLYKKKFSIFMTLISVVVFWFSGIIAYINGRNLLAPFTIYFSQTGTYEKMYLNVTSFWILLGNNYEFMKGFAILFTIVILGIGLYLILSKKVEVRTPYQFVTIAAWGIWVCVFFLPAMHERYTYLLDILLIIAAFLDKKYVKYAVVSCSLSLLTYGNYLFDNGGVDKLCVLLYLASWLHFSYTILCGYRNEKESLEEVKKKNC